MLAHANPAVVTSRSAPVARAKWSRSESFVSRATPSRAPRAGATDHPREGVGVRRRDLLPGQDLVAAVQVRDLVAGGEERNRRPPVDGDRLVRNRGQDAELGRTKRRPGRQHRLAQPDVLTAKADVAACVAWVTDRHGGVCGFRVLLANHAVGAGGEGGTGEDLGRLARAQRARRELAGGDRLDHAQHRPGMSVGGARQA
jgi:hypothetical protein